MTLRSLFAMSSALALVACDGKEMTDLEAYVQRVKAREPDPIQPLPEIEQIDTFVFEPEERRDPFVLDLQSAEVTDTPVRTGITPDPLRRKEELEQFPLDSLKMVGTLQQGETRWALIRTPQDTLLHVRAGNYMGMNSGRITRITEEEIELTEIVPDGVGGWRMRQAVIALSE